MEEIVNYLHISNYLERLQVLIELESFDDFLNL